MNRVFRKYCILLIVSALSFCLSSCHEKGCTDKNAINYNSVADEDDGSCITCSAVVDTLGVMSVDLYDNNFSSPHFQDNVARFHITQIKNKYAYTECGTNECIFKVKIESLVIEKMTFTFNLQANGNIFFNYVSNVEVEGNQTVYVGDVPSNNVSNPCGFITSTSFFVQTNGNIIYN